MSPASDASEGDDDLIFLFERPKSVKNENLSSSVNHENQEHSPKPSQDSLEQLSQGHPQEQPADVRTQACQEEVPHKGQATLESQGDNIGDFKAFLSDHVPADFLSRQDQARLRFEAEERLKLARESGINIEDLRIGHDCLPTWKSIYWDDEKIDLHETIQSRLSIMELAQNLGDLMRDELYMKGNQRLEDARAQGIKLERLFIGDDLLPTWRTPEIDEDVVEGQTDHDVLLAAQLLSEDAATEPDYQPELSQVLDAQDLAVEEARTDDSFDSTATLAFSSASPTRMSPAARSNNTDTTSESDVEELPQNFDDDDFDDVLSLHNFVDPTPIYSDASDNVSGNILHDTQVVNEDGVIGACDLEVYMVESDEDVSELPQLEIGVDRISYEYYCSSSDAVDVEMEGFEVRCSDAFKSESSADDDDEVDDDGGAPDEAEEEVVEEPKCHRREASAVTLRPARPQAMAQQHSAPFVQPQGGPLAQIQGEAIVQIQSKPLTQNQGEPHVQSQCEPTVQNQGETLNQNQGDKEEASSSSEELTDDEE